MSLCVSMLFFAHIGSPATELWRLVDYQRQRGSRGGAVLRMIAYLVTLLWSKGQNLLYKPIISTCIKSLLRNNYNRLEKQTSAILEFHFWMRWRPQWRNLTSGSGLGDVTFSRRSIVYQRTKFRRDNPSHSWYITISVLEKQTSTVIEIFLPVSTATISQ